jgi:hypothetical protein
MKIKVKDPSGNKFLKTGLALAGGSSFNHGVTLFDTAKTLVVSTLFLNTLTVWCKIFSSAQGQTSLTCCTSTVFNSYSTKGRSERDGISFVIDGKKE